MAEKKGDKPNVDNPLDNLGGDNTTKKPEETKSVDPQTEKLLELVGKLSKQVESFQKTVEDQDQQIKDLKDQKAVGPGMDGIAEIIKEIRKTSGPTQEHNPLKYYNVDELDPEDVLEEPTIFYAYGTGYVITDDKRNGKPVLTPFGNPIFFTHQATQKIGTGKHVSLHSYSTYPSYSKKETAWLKEHKRFGIHFFETVKEAMDTNTDVAARVSKHLNSINNLEIGQIVKIYRQKGLPNTTDIAKMRNSLALLAVQEEVQNERSNQEKYFKDIFETNALLKDKITG